MTLHTIHIFKTDIKTEYDVALLKPVFDGHAGILQWSVDIQDVDCVLRIVTQTLSENDLISLLQAQGYHCAELV